ncbi:Tudor domain-containing protein [Mycena chlorophos]|uniref:Serine/threonine-protein kinase RIO2 n=1 Tax=Mycena chlorophos TaxID=658473 RepID=A0A8H6T3E2_MYCCL|nr:Tudor domain-containing protein [Mycena chlorophos]
MKLDATDLRYVTPDEFRVLTAVEMGSKNHEVVPTVLIAQISGLRNGGVNKLIGSLAKRNLVSKVQNSKYDGYRLTYGGYDYLAMRALSKRDSMHSVGNQIGVGKESDIYIVADADGSELVLKLHRLGRISFRAIKEKRDYLGKRKSASWMYMSRLAAQKEWAFMKVLHEHGFPVPRPVDQARHCILMELIDAYPLRQISEVPSPGNLYSTLMDLIVRFAHAGLIHGDFNEFNILIRRETGEPVVIDFPQMVSTSHENAEWYFNRDVECIRTFFRRRFRYESALYPRFKSIMNEEGIATGDFRLDVMVSASGFKQKDMKTLEEYMEAVKEEEPGESSHESEESGSEESESSDSDVDDTDEQKPPVEEPPSSESEAEHDDDQFSEPSRSLSRSPPRSRPDSPAVEKESNAIKEIVSEMSSEDLETYKVQLAQVELAISSDPDNAELQALRTELDELIELTKSAVVAQAAAATSAKAESSRKANPANKAHTWAAGDECLAKYSGDGSYYPARITTVGGSTDNPVYNIVFKGYNTTEQAKASELKPLPPHYNLTAPASSKRKLTPAEEEERERKKKKNEKKLEVKAAKAKEQTEKQATWQKFTKKSEKKGVHIAGVAGTSIFKTPDNPLGRVGVTGSGKGMTSVATQSKHKFAPSRNDDGY